MLQRMIIEEFFKKYPKIAVAFSGGTDSAFLLYLAKHHAQTVCAYYVRSQFQPDFEYRDAVNVAQILDVPLTVLDIDILKYEQITSNPDNRCYYCKSRIMSAILERANADGFSVLADGTNASDDASDRPGMAVLLEKGIVSPLKLCGLTKKDVRQRSKEAQLPTWDKPSYACLATRIPTGMKITDRLLVRTEESEEYMASLGFTDFRVRTAGDDALIQITGSQATLYDEKRQDIEAKLGRMYKKVILDTVRRDER